MQKFVLTSRFGSLLLPSLTRYCHSNPSKSPVSLITSSFRLSHNRACSSTPDLIAKNSVLIDYLVGSLKLSKHRALSVSSTSRFSHVKSLEKPEKVVHFFRSLGFSDAHIQSIAHRLPRLLLANVEKTLKPKVIFFQELGLSGPCLGSFFSKNPNGLTCSVERSLKPCIRLIEKVLSSDGRIRSDEKVKDDVFQIISRCNSIVNMKCRMEANILYLESCGVVGSQLSSLLLRQTRLFVLPKEKLEQFVSRAVAMGFALAGSRMLAHAIHTLSCTSIKTLNGKFEVFTTFGFSKDDVASMFRKGPHVFQLSETRLRSRVEFFLNILEIDKLLLLRNPTLLALSLEGRVIPRCKVVEILKSRRLLKKDFGFLTAMMMSNQQFLEKLVWPFENDTEELLLAYNGELLDTSEK